MKKQISTILLLFAVWLTSSSQANYPGQDVIKASEMRSHMEFLASPVMRGRENGEPELDIALNYIASQASLMGLKPGNKESYFQNYEIIRTSIDEDKTAITILNDSGDSTVIKKPVYQLLPTGPAEFSLSGEVVFAGYGLRQDKYGYDDFNGINAEGKIIIILSGAPTSKDGKEYLFDGTDWSDFNSIQVKLISLLFSRAKAVVIVPDPKSGYKSVAEQYPGIEGELSYIRKLKGDKPAVLNISGAPKILYADRQVADELLKGSQYSLESLQMSIDNNLKPISFQIPGKRLRIREAVISEELVLKNVAAIVEGSDPVLKKEFIVYSAHADHIGAGTNTVNPGADDDASGCAAVLSIARAFSALEKKPARSVLFLWVSGEEIGLYGSRSYVNSPLVPLENTIVNLNMDMIGRVKEAADSTSETPMTGPDEVFVIACNQSKDLMEIASKIDKENPIDFDYSLSGRNHPLQLFARSDHYNFVKKDIPVLFFSTGLHSDYHTPRDVLEKIDYGKMEQITKAMYQIGYNLSTRKERIKVDNPFSKW